MVENLRTSQLSEAIMPYDCFLRQINRGALYFIVIVIIIGFNYDLWDAKTLEILTLIGPLLYEVF